MSFPLSVGCLPARLPTSLLHERKRHPRMGGRLNGRGRRIYPQEDGKQEEADRDKSEFKFNVQTKPEGDNKLQPYVSGILRFGRGLSERVARTEEPY